MYYRVGGSGVDQIALLNESTVRLYEDPLVIFSVMTLDLNCSLLTVRIGQNPYYRIENGTLTLKGTPIDPDPASFYASYHPQIRSYLYRRLFFSRLVPDRVAAAFRGDSKLIERKKEIDAATHSEVAADLHSRDLDDFFLIFLPHWKRVSWLDNKADWRQQFLQELSKGWGVPYLSAKEIFAQDAGPSPDFSAYILPGNGLPQLISTRSLHKQPKTRYWALTRAAIPCVFHRRSPKTS